MLNFGHTSDHCILWHPELVGLLRPLHLQSESREASLAHPRTSFLGTGEMPLEAAVLDSQAMGRRGAGANAARQIH